MSHIPGWCFSLSISDCLLRCCVSSLHLKIHSIKSHDHSIGVFGCACFPNTRVINLIFHLTIITSYALGVMFASSDHCIYIHTVILDESVALTSITVYEMNVLYLQALFLSLNILSLRT